MNRWIIGAGMSAVTCCTVILPTPSGTDTCPPVPDKTPETPRVLDITVHRRDDEGQEREYHSHVLYDGELACQQRAPHDLTHVPLHGHALQGHFQIAVPAICELLSGLTLSITPHYQHCRARQTSLQQLTAEHVLVVLIDCDSARRIAQLEALPLLGCPEDETQVSAHGDAEFLVEGCGRKVRLARVED